MKAVKLSRPLVGSSRTSKEGSENNSKAMQHLFFSPPEIPLMRVPPT